MTSKLTGEGDVDAVDVKKYTLPISLIINDLSIDMKTKVVWHVPRIIFKCFQRFKSFESFQ